MDTALMSPVRIQLQDGAPRIVKKEELPDQRVLTIIPLRAAKDRRLSAMDLRVLAVLASYSNKAGLTWVGMARVGADLGVTRQRINQVVKRLEAHGYVKTVFQGWRGERADTRQIIFRDDITPTKAARVSGELAPYQHEAKRRAEKMKARRKRKGEVLPDLEENYQDEGVDSFTQSSKAPLGVDPDIYKLALTYAGEGASAEDVDRALRRLLE